MLLRPGAARASLVSNPAIQTDVWAYNGMVPGPEIRIRQGQRLRARLENTLPQETTIHWHGLRIPNAMDGVPGVTQDAVKPGAVLIMSLICPMREPTGTTRMQTRPNNWGVAFTAP